MLGQASRHIEFFVTPLASADAERFWLSASGTSPLTEQRYRKPSVWKQGSALYFEHAVPSADLKASLLALGAKPSSDAVRKLVEQAEIVWITREEEARLRNQMKGASKGPRSDWRALYNLAGIDILDIKEPDIRSSK